MVWPPATGSRLLSYWKPRRPLARRSATFGCGDRRIVARAATARAVAARWTFSRSTSRVPGTGTPTSGGWDGTAVRVIAGGACRLSVDLARRTSCRSRCRRRRRYSLTMVSAAGEGAVADAVADAVAVVVAVAVAVAVADAEAAVGRPPPGDGRNRCRRRRVRRLVAAVIVAATGCFAGCSCRHLWRGSRNCAFATVAAADGICQRHQNDRYSSTAVQRRTASTQPMALRCCLTAAFVAVEYAAVVIVAVVAAAGQDSVGSSSDTNTAVVGLRRCYCH